MMQVILEEEGHELVEVEVDEVYHVLNQPSMSSMCIFFSFLYFEQVYAHVPH